MTMKDIKFIILVSIPTWVILNIIYELLGIEYHPIAIICGCLIGGFTGHFLYDSIMKDKEQ